MITTPLPSPRMRELNRKRRVLCRARLRYAKRTAHQWMPSLPTTFVWPGR